MLSKCFDIDLEFPFFENTITELSSNLAPTAHASTATTYGIGTASKYGHVKLSDTYASKVSSGAAANGVCSSQNALYNAFRKLMNSLVLYKVVFEEYTEDNITVNASGSATITFDGTQKTNGYTRAMMTVRLANASTSGVGSSFCAVYNCHPGGTADTFSTALVRNHNSATAAKIQATARILYIYDKGACTFSPFDES